MNKTWAAVLFLLVILMLLLLGLSAPVLAAPHAQLTPFPTPTAGPDGRIVYIVQPGDTLWRVSAITGVPLEELRELNNLGVNDVIVPDQELLLGLGGPSIQEPTSGPAPTRTPVLPTPTPSEGTAVMCVLLYEDVNGDAIRQEEEPSLPGGAISISNRAGTVSITEDTVAGLEPQCFEELDRGDYNVSVAIPDGYNPTTVLNYPITLQAGDETFLDFGAQPNSETIAQAPAPAGEGNSPLLGIVGGALLLVGLVLGVYALLLRR
jgi:LysM repeat protein